jgi:hypothetical protein
MKKHGSPASPENLSKSLAFCGSAAPLVTEGLKGNPRQVKRFLNAFVLRKKLAEVAKLTNIDDAILVKLMILEYSQEGQGRFRQLFDWQAAQDGQPDEIVRLEKALREPDGRLDDEEAAKKVHPDWATSVARRWIAMAPPLLGVDLRDYFWVARDRLQATFAGLSMVPPVVRRAFESLLADNAAKRKTGATTAAELTEDEREALYGLLGQQIKFKPSEKAGYDAFRVLIENDVSGAANRFAQVLPTVPAEAIPAAVGMDLATLSKAKPAVAAILAPALKRLEESGSKAGAAAKQGKSHKGR